MRPNLDSDVAASWCASRRDTSNVPNTQTVHVFNLAGQPLLEIGDISAPTQIETVQFMDGSIWTVEGLIAEYRPTAGSDLFFGSPNADSISGEGGHDLLVGNEGPDTLRGGPGDDILYGGFSVTPADDTFVFSQPIGHDTVYDYYGTNDRFVFEDVPSTAVGFQQHAQDLIFVGPGWSVVFYAHWAPVSYAKLERVEFSDGVVWDQATLEAHYAASTQP